MGIKYPEYTIIRLCYVCKEKTENTDERLCNKCKSAIMFVRSLLEKETSDEDNSTDGRDNQTANET